MIALVQAAQGGSEQALTELVERSRSLVRGIVYTLVKDTNRTDDIVQTVWLRVTRQIGKLREPALWDRWLYRIARNAALDEIVANKRRTTTQMELTVDPRDDRTAPPAAAKLARQEQHERVLAAIRGLPRIYREPFTLRHLRGMKHREIAAALDMPTATLETRLTRARRLLREELKDLVDD